MEKLVGEIRNGAGRFATLAVKNLLDRSVSRSSGLLKRYRENGIGDEGSRGAAEKRRRRVVLIKRQRRKKKWNIFSRQRVPSRDIQIPIRPRYNYATLRTDLIILREQPEPGRAFVPINYCWSFTGDPRHRLKVPRSKWRKRKMKWPGPSSFSQVPCFSMSFHFLFRHQTILFRCCNSGRCGLNDATIVNSCKDDKNRGCCSKMVENTFSISRNSNRYPIFYLTILLSFSFVFTFYTQDVFIFDKNRFRDYSFNTERMVS